MAVDAVPVADYKQVEALLAAHVRGQRVSILVHFVGIARLVAARRGESELGDGVEPFITGFDLLSSVAGGSVPVFVAAFGGS